MRDREHAEAGLAGHRLDAAGDVAQRVDVEAGVDLVEDRELRLEHRELQRLGALLLAARELVVHAARRGTRRRTPRRSASARDRGRAGPSRVAPRRVERRGRRSPRAARPGTSTGYCIARKSPRAARCQVGRPSSSSPSIVTEPRGDRRSRRGPSARATSVDLPEPFGPIERVHLARRDLEVDAAQDLVARDRRVQVGDLQTCSPHGSTTDHVVAVDCARRTPAPAGSPAASAARR